MRVALELRRMLPGGRLPRRLTAPSTLAWMALEGAARRLGFESIQHASLQGCLPDILSEAIEEVECDE